MSSLRVLGLCAGVLAMHCAGAQPQQSAHRALESLAQDMLYTTARTYPMTATFLGLPGHDGELEKPSEAFRAAQVARLQQWQSRLGSIIAGFDVHTSLVDRDDATLLQARLTASLDELLVYQADRKDYSHPANSIVRAVFVQFQHLPVVGQEGATAAALRRAWADIAARLAGAP
ncbi:MAG: hypothetical protein WA747_10130, partial [Steroidobacteraceae bacterium]